MRWLWLAVGLGASVVVTAILWWLRVPGFFLFLPFLAWPVLARSRGRTCPACGWRARGGSDLYCPRDGNRLT